MSVSLMLFLMTGTVFAEDISQLRKKAVEKGQLSVIVGLRFPAPGFKPEGTLSNGEAVKQQREAIADIRKKLLNSLVGYKILVYAVYESLPYVAMRVDLEALEKLAKSQYVTTILEDLAEKPHKNGYDPEPSEDAAADTKTGGSD